MPCRLRRGSNGYDRIWSGMEARGVLLRRLEQGWLAETKKGLAIATPVVVEIPKVRSSDDTIHRKHAGMLEDKTNLKGRIELRRLQYVEAGQPLAERIDH